MSTGDLILAADFGTSAVKLGLVAQDFTLQASTTRPYPLAMPGPGQAEQNPADWWQALADGTADLATQVPDLAQRVGGIVFCAQMCGVVSTGADGTPLRPALIWIDKRAAPLIRRKMSGWPAVAGYGVLKVLPWLLLANGAPSLNGMDPAAKMLWLQKHDPQVYNRTAHLLDVRDWLALRATGIASTTADSANLTWMMDTRRGREGWSPPLARRLGLRLDKLPPIVDGSSVVGGLTGGAARDLGLRPDTPVIAGGSDVSATAIGSGAVDDGALHLCLSTSSWVAGFFNRRVLNATSGYATITSSVGYRPLLIATQETAGAALEWSARILAPGDTAPVLNSVYADLGPGQPDDPFFLPWLAGERAPVDDARLRGAFHGLSLRHDGAALRRSVIEGVALNTRWAFDKVVRERGARTTGPLPVVGGAADNPALAQALADALNRQVRVGNTRFSGVLGAAAMAAPALGWTDDVWQAAGRIGAHGGPVYDPDPASVRHLQARHTRLTALRKRLIRLYRDRAVTGGSA